METNETADAMRKMADHSVALAGQLNYTLDFTPESIDILEQYLSDLHEHLLTPESTWTENMKWSAAVIHGAYIGEVLRRNCGGEWQAGTIANPQFEVGQVEILPAAKVMMRLNNGLEDHVGHYYGTILTCVGASRGKSGRVVIG